MLSDRCLRQRSDTLVCTVCRGLGPGHILLDGEPAPLPKRGQSPQFSAHISIVAKPLYVSGYHLVQAYAAQPRRHCVRWESSSPSPKGAVTQFMAHVYCGRLAVNGWMDQDATWYGGKPRPGDVVLDGIAAPPKRGTAPSFRPIYVYCGQTTGWMKTSLSTEVELVDLGPARPHCVRRG